MKNFEDLTQKELKEMYEKMKEQEKDVDEPVEKPTRWRAKIGEVYWLVDHLDGNVRYTYEENLNIDNIRYNTGNYFQSREQAEEYMKKLLYQQEYKDWCRFDIDWRDNTQEKYFAYYNYTKNKINYSNNYGWKREGTIYAKSVKTIKDFVKKIGGVNFKKYILEVE